MFVGGLNHAQICELLKSFANIYCTIKDEKRFVVEGLVDGQHYPAAKRGVVQTAATNA